MLFIVWAVYEATLPAAAIPQSDSLPSHAQAGGFLTCLKSSGKHWLSTLGKSVTASVPYRNMQKACPGPSIYQSPKAIFVTLSYHGQRVRGDLFILSQNLDLVKATVFTTENALTKEYRYPRIRASEWRMLKPQVTVIKGLEPIAAMSEQNPVRYGLLVRSGGKGAVFLPGEARDAHYQLVQCKLKAGIPVNQPCQLYRINADVLF